HGILDLITASFEGYEMREKIAEKTLATRSIVISPTLYKGLLLQPSLNKLLTSFSRTTLEAENRRE
ncbi:MAG TPA: hypothetical protein VEP90_10020, partial [Methylomirabilota bacterium]|nr:hypothetical protein [Methylomirabilota bacterium]